jgi:methionyl-tRNA formyltransferase
MLLREAVPIPPDASTGVLHDRLAALGARLIVEALELAACGGLVPVPQGEGGVTYAHKIDKAEAAVRWDEPAAQIERRIRAFDPFPGATTSIDGEPVKLWRAEVVAGRGSPGEVLAVDAGGLTVACGDAALRLTELQRAGGRRLAAREFLAGRPVAVGTRLG